MTESIDKESLELKKGKLNILTKKFEEKDITIFLDENGEGYIPKDKVGEALEYSRPERDINKIIERHADEFTDKTKAFPLEQFAPPVEALSQDGIYLIGMFSRQPKAKLFRQWAIKTLSDHQTMLTDPIEFFLQATNAALKRLKHHGEQLAFHGRQIVYQGDKIGEIEQELREQTISLLHQDYLHAKVKQIVELTDHSYGEVWKAFNEHFNLPQPNSRRARYLALPDHQFSDACSYLDDYLNANRSHTPLDYYNHNRREEKS